MAEAIPVVIGVQTNPRVKTRGYVYEIYNETNLFYVHGFNRELMIKLGPKGDLSAPRPISFKIDELCLNLQSLILFITHNPSTYIINPITD